MHRTTHSLARRSRSAAGYTLIEIMVVLSIISVLLGASIFFMGDLLGTGRRAAAKSGVRTLQAYIMAYSANTGKIPTTEQGLSALYQRPTVGPVPARWQAIADIAATKDPWDRPYRYACPGQHSKAGFDIYSLGEDGKEGTEDDIGNWSN
ncbi:MAG: type II secretion system major pseudopilin GspG [Candidatus Methylacidiphilales bacterium]|nr:type II secretion system major pseudopilin GspG [Candidatus Methylacidiphilales bacterium]